MARHSDQTQDGGRGPWAVAAIADPSDIVLNTHARQCACDCLRLWLRGTYCGGWCTPLGERHNNAPCQAMKLQLVSRAASRARRRECGAIEEAVKARRRHDATTTEPLHSCLQRKRTLLARSPPVTSAAAEHQHRVWMAHHQAKSTRCLDALACALPLRVLRRRPPKQHLTSFR